MERCRCARVPRPRRPAGRTGRGARGRGPGRDDHRGVRALGGAGGRASPTTSTCRTGTPRAPRSLSGALFAARPGRHACRRGPASRTRWTDDQDPPDPAAHRGHARRAVEQRASWYVDSRYTGSDVPGRPVETALTRDLVAHVDARTARRRSAGPHGRRLLHGRLGRAALRAGPPGPVRQRLVLSPAVYRRCRRPTPRPASTARTARTARSSPTTCTSELNYPALLPKLDPDLPVRLFIAVGDDEYANPDPADAHHDLDFESAALYNAAGGRPRSRRSSGSSTAATTGPSGRPRSSRAMAELGPTLSVTPPAGLPAPLYGTAARTGPVAWRPTPTVADHRVRGERARRRPAVRGTAGRGAGPRRGGRRGRDSSAPPPTSGSTASRRCPTAGSWRPVTPRATWTATTRATPRTTRSWSGSMQGRGAWLTQFGAPGVADRLYGLAAAPDGGAYVGRIHQGRARRGQQRGQGRAGRPGSPPTARSPGSASTAAPGRTRRTAWASSGTNLYVTGSATAVLPGTTALGGLDGWLAGYDLNGTRKWATPWAAPVTTG